MNNWTLSDFEKMFDDFSKVLPQSDPKAKKQRRILDAAATLLQKYGYRKTSMDDVAKEAGVAKGTLYLYFKTKADLVIQVIAEEKRSYIKEMGPILEESNPTVRLTKWMESGIELGSKMPITSRLATQDTDLKDILDEISEEDRQKSEAFGNAFISALIGDTKNGATVTAEERVERAKVLRAIFTYSLKMLHSNVCGGLDTTTFAKTLSHVLVHGAASKPR